MGEEVKVPLEVLEKTQAAMGQLKNEIDALKKSAITEEAFMAKGEELVKIAIKEHEEKTAVEREKRALFPTMNIDGDPRMMALKSAGQAQNAEDRLSRISHAFTLPTESKALEAFPKVHDELVIVNAAMAAKNRGNYRGMESLDTFKRFSKARADVLKTMDTTDTSAWVPTGESNVLLDVPYLTGPVENLFEHVYCPTKIFDYPVLLNGPTTIGVLVSENTAHVDPTTDPGAQALTDGKFTWTAKKIRGRMVTSGELNEDSIVAMIPAIKGELPRITARSVETAIINGDLTGLAGTHMDADVEALGATDPRNAWYGLRYFSTGVAGLKVDGATFTLAKLRSVRAAMGAYGVNPLDLALIMSIRTYLSTIVTNDDVRTQNVYGPRATVFTGQLEQFDGSAVVVSEHMPINLHTTGYNTGANTTSSIVYVNKNYFKIGDRRLFTIESNRLLNADQLEFVSFRRLDFQPHATPSATYSSVGVLYGVTA